jgi:3-hydroxyisobutyrate dehydrogenase-like beta-hydroxyacid dehydrogenase
LNIASDESWPRSIGVIGLGIMGSAVARYLAAAGREVIGFDIDPSRAQEIAGLCFGRVASAVAAAEKADLLLTSLPAEDSLAAVVDGILGAGCRPG